MDLDDLKVDDYGVHVSRVDGHAERKIMAEESRRAREREVCREVDRMRRRQTVKELLLAALALAAIYVALRQWAAPDAILPLEAWLGLR